MNDSSFDPWLAADFLRLGDNRPQSSGQFEPDNGNAPEYGGKISDSEELVKDDDGEWYSGSREEILWQIHWEPVQPSVPDFVPWNYGIKPGKSLRERFADLQVIVKIGSTELTPDKPEFPVGGWHVEGQMNEHIVATALYYLNSENIAQTSLQFRMQTLEDKEDSYEVGQGQYTWMERVFGTHLGTGLE